MDSLQERLEEVRRRVARAAERAHRDPAEIEVVAVSKTVDPAMIVESYRLGQRSFGENRVQEFREKGPLLEAVQPMPQARWHLVGHLQSNKAKPAVQLFDIIQSVDSVRLAQLLDRHAGELGKRLPVLLQVDFSTEPQRSGFTEEEVEAALPDLVSLPNLEVRGLMTVAPLGLDEEGLRRVFRRLRWQRERLESGYPSLEWRHLSMGMSEDFEIAIEEGATMVRIGRAIFGARPPAQGGGLGKDVAG